MRYSSEEHHCSSTSACSAGADRQRGSTERQHSHRCRESIAAWQALKPFLLLALLLQAQQCSGQPGVLPPMPPLGFFGGLLDGLGLGTSSPPVTTSAPVVSSTYRTPQGSASIQPQDAASTSTGTIVPVVSASPASLAPPRTAAPAAPVSTLAPATPADPVTPVTVPRAVAPPAPPTVLRPGEALPCTLLHLHLCPYLCMHAHAVLPAHHCRLSLDEAAWLQNTSEQMCNGVIITRLALQ